MYPADSSTRIKQQAPLFLVGLRIVAPHIRRSTYKRLDAAAKRSTGSPSWLYCLTTIECLVKGPTSRCISSNPDWDASTSHPAAISSELGP